jgi:indole-3-glycerol phosphate synthase
MSATAPDLLRAILAATERRVAVQAVRQPIATLEERARARGAARQVLRSAIGRPDRTNIIAECKRRSPSKGVLRWNYDAVDIARGYEAAGTAAISVLTEPTFFDGSIDDLSHVRAAVSLPLLRKDFIVDRYQIVEARAAGADAVLLIVAALDDSQLRDLMAAATENGVDVLVEVHDEHELERALRADASIIGVNNRNLRTLTVDVDASYRLARLMPPTVLAVAESGLRMAMELQSLRDAGYAAFLIGERFMAAENPGLALRGLLHEARGSVHAGGTERGA